MALKRGNKDTSLAIFTASGIQALDIHTYNEAVLKLRPDIVVPAADIEHGLSIIGRKRKDKMDERTLAWVRNLHHALQQQQQNSESESIGPSLWPPILSIEPEQQRSYTDWLCEQPLSSFGGISIYSSNNMADLPSHLRSLPRLTLTEPTSPQDILTLISLGADLLTIPFITSVSESGMAFTYKFPPPTQSSFSADSSSRLPLAFDLWSPSHSTALQPLVPNCPCYACKTHHRAYIHHLLNAKEMLAWVLLQLHNHHVMSEFMSGVRESLQAGTFTQSAERFLQTYESEFPPAQGEGPRVRGYQMASRGPGEPKRNKAPYGILETPEQKAARHNRGPGKMRDEGAEKVRESVEAGLGDDVTDHAMGLDHLYVGSNE